MKYTLLIIGFLFTAFSIRSQVVSDVTAELAGGKVTVHYSLQSIAPANCFLSYSADGGRTFHPCVNVSGDLWAQTSGAKTITWNHVADNMHQGTLFFKVEALKVEQAQPTVVATPTTTSPTVTTPAVTPKITPNATFALTNNPNIEMVFVEGGTFDMNKNYRATLSSYYIGKYEVTQAQWEAVMGNNPSKFRGDNLPVESVSWGDVQIFLGKLNSMTGKNYRLPTEAEWEFAARGGNQSKRYEYSGSNNLDEVAWYTKKAIREVTLLAQNCLMN